MRYCEICDRQTIHIYDEVRCNHVLHLLLSMATGFWLIIWFFVALGSHDTKPVCTICGWVMPKEMAERLEADRKLRDDGQIYFLE